MEKKCTEYFVTLYIICTSCTDSGNVVYMVFTSKTKIEEKAFLNIRCYFCGTISTIIVYERKMYFYGVSMIQLAIYLSISAVVYLVCKMVE